MQHILDLECLLGPMALDLDNNCCCLDSRTQEPSGGLGLNIYSACISSRTPEPEALLDPECLLGLMVLDLG